MWAEIPEWAKPDLWLDENNALRFFTDVEHSPEITGATWWHRKPNGGGWHAGGFQWTNTARYPGGPVWQLVQRDPLTISPSLLCLSADCGAHGFIREGKWVPA